MKLQTRYYKRLLKDFDTHIMSTKSIRRGNHYSGQIKSFLIFLEKQNILKLHKVNANVMKAYYKHLITRPKERGKGTLSPLTVNDNLSSLRLFSLRMQKGNEIERGLPIPLFVKIEKDSDNPFTLTRQVLTVEELKEVYSLTATNIEKCIIALAYGCGLRRLELENLKDTDINYQQGIVTIIQSKNNKTRTVPISNYFIKVLKEYNYERLHILSETGKRTQYFMINKYGQRLTGTIMNRRLKAVIKRTKNQTIIDKNITLHCLRHGIATDLINAGESFEYVRVFLGHSLVDTSSLYAKRRKQRNKYQI
jgi:site-specific recombinase XerD